MNLRKVFSRTFWLIMAIHFIVFIIIGFVSGDWHLLMIFVPLLVLTGIIKYILLSKKKNTNN